MEVERGCRLPFNRCLSLSKATQPPSLRTAKNTTDQSFARPRPSSAQVRRNSASAAASSKIRSSCAAAACLTCSAAAANPHSGADRATGGSGLLATLLPLRDCAESVSPSARREGDSARPPAGPVAAPSFAGC